MCCFLNVICGCKEQAWQPDESVPETKSCSGEGMRDRGIAWAVVACQPNLWIHALNITEWLTYIEEQEEERENKKERKRVMER